MLSMLTMLIKTVVYQNHAMLVYAMPWDQLELFWTICLQDSTVTDQTLLDVFNYVEYRQNVINISIINTVVLAEIVQYIFNGGILRSKQSGTFKIFGDSILTKSHASLHKVVCSLSTTRF